MNGSDDIVREEYEAFRKEYANETEPKPPKGSNIKHKSADQGEIDESTHRVARKILSRFLYETGCEYLATSLTIGR
jgi:hypothetical protein